MLNRLYLVLGVSLVALFGWSAWSGLELGGSQRRMPAAGQAASSWWHSSGSGHYSDNSSRSGVGVFGGK
jgi:hypothetical protein